MLRIKNLTNSPYPILLADGSKELLPARGEIDADIHPQHLSLYRSLGYFVISNVMEEVVKQRLRALHMRIAISVGALAQAHPRQFRRSADGRARKSKCPRNRLA